MRLKYSSEKEIHEFMELTDQMENRNLNRYTITTVLKAARSTKC